MRKRSPEAEAASVRASMERRVKKRTKWPGFEQELAIERLLSHYSQLGDNDKWTNPGFMSGFARLVERNDAKSLNAEAKRLADEWGLTAPWAPTRIADEVRANVRSRRRDPNAQLLFPLLPIRVERHDGTLSTWRERELERNISWLYQHRALKKLPIQILDGYKDLLDAEIRIARLEMDVARQKRDSQRPLVASLRNSARWYESHQKAVVAFKYAKARFDRASKEKAKRLTQSAVEDGIRIAARLIDLDVPRGRPPRKHPTRR